MALTRRFLCPACGFAVFNRRLPTCERCKAVLPEEYVFKPEQLAAIEAEHERYDEMRKDIGREVDERAEARAKKWKVS